jgi:hypothetical protein
VVVVWLWVLVLVGAVFSGGGGADVWRWWKW